MRDDEEIKVDIAKQLKWDARIDASKISIKVNNGNVILEGSVPAMTAKSAAFDSAYLVEGVLSVTDNLNVAIPETRITPGDTEIHDNIEKTLSINSVVEPYEIDISVKNGWVNMEGTVNEFWEKVNAERAVLDVSGVLGVSNNLVVVPTESYEDEAIAEDIINALERNSQIYADEIDVMVEDGNVTLDGTVETYAAKDNAYDAAAYTPGVTSVKNRISVGSKVAHQA